MTYTVTYTMMYTNIYHAPWRAPLPHRGSSEIPFVEYNTAKDGAVRREGVGGVGVADTDVLGMHQLNRNGYGVHKRVGAEVKPGQVAAAEADKGVLQARAAGEKGLRDGLDGRKHIPPGPVYRYHEVSSEHAIRARVVG